MRKKKSQIHMMETIAVIAIFFILFMVGFVFYSKVFKSGLEETKVENIELEAIKIAQRASSLPELQCSRDNVVKENCIDKLKLDSASVIMKNTDNEIYYFDKLAFSKITIQEIYPNLQDCEAGECTTIYDRNLPLDELSSKILTNIPITIFYPIEKKNVFGVMKVELFTR